ncbi:glycine cleavage system protein R [Agaribacterium haliotis]|uniref:glycine cleavage system protein R n=1 Tax=Agaribacterium haliotis TaxID=2013869 RepID=UPI000BB554CF|nr:ACT domain-containing protein [Agaribacterium haliotis]
MQKHYILSVTSDDKPGLVEAIASVVEGCGGNWLESRLAHLSGKFVGVVRIAIEKSAAEKLLQQLKALKQDGIDISAADIPSGETSKAPSNARFSAVGPDRSGIIKEISRAFSRHNINVEELESDLSSMPYSGEPIFEARGTLSVPADLELRSLHEKMDAIANDLGLDLDVEAI